MRPARSSRTGPSATHPSVSPETKGLVFIGGPRSVGMAGGSDDPFDAESTHISHQRDPFEAFGLDAHQSDTRAEPNGRSSSQRCGKHTPLPAVDELAVDEPHDPSDDEGEVYYLKCTERYPGWANATHRRLAMAAAFALVAGGAGLWLWQLRNADAAVPHRLVHHRSRVPPPPPAPNALPSGAAWPSSSDEEGDDDYAFWRTPPSPPSLHPPPSPPSRRPPPSPPPLASAPAAVPSHELINARFKRDPYAGWLSVPSAGVLLHCIDGYEDHAQPWLPGTRSMVEVPPWQCHSSALVPL